MKCGVLLRVQRKAGSAPTRGHSMGDVRSGMALSGEAGGGPSKLSGSQSDDDEDGHRAGVDDIDGDEGAAFCPPAVLHATCMHACSFLICSRQPQSVTAVVSAKRAGDRAFHSMTWRGGV